MDTQQRINEIRERLNAATPGSWTPDPAMSGPDCGIIYSSTEEPICQVFGNGYDEKRQEQYGDYDIDFITHAPTDVAWLLEQLQAVRDEVSKWNLSRILLDEEQAAIVNQLKGVRIEATTPLIEVYSQPLNRLFHHLQAVQRLLGEEMTPLEPGEPDLTL